MSFEFFAESSNTSKSNEYLKIKFMIENEVRVINKTVKKEYKDLVVSKDNRTKSSYSKGVISNAISQMKELGLFTPSLPDFVILPRHITYIIFKFKLNRPYISRDDDGFYIIENPVRKEKVFKIPMISPSSWKGILRWVMMKEFLEPFNNAPNIFSKNRFRSTMLFGNERGYDQGTNWTEYLNELCPEAIPLYHQQLRQYLNLNDQDSIPSIKGHLNFYPTFFDAIGLEEINPHKRKTGAGTQPIYIESVPVDSKGYFSLLYTPSFKDSIEEYKEVLSQVSHSISKMFLYYGFSAKRTSGYGEACNQVEESKLYIMGNLPISFSCLDKLQENIENVFRKE
jgi:CRISPR-associated protein Cmr2